MPPVRTHNVKDSAETSSSKRKTYSTHRHPKTWQNDETSSAVPGVQKVKSALRQTRRLLAKDKLAADVRVETERRLKALEAELQTAVVARKERTLAVRYHKVKFFERQKIIRKITQAQKRLGQAGTKSERRNVASELQELRVDMNYILHYPKLKRYISLFPPEVRKGEGVSATSQTEAQETIAEREQIRIWIRERMERGELHAEPELMLGSRREVGETEQWPSNEPMSILKTKPRTETNDVEADDEFFGEDEEEDP